MRIYRAGQAFMLYKASIRSSNNCTVHVHAFGFKICESGTQQSDSVRPIQLQCIKFVTKTRQSQQHESRWELLCYKNLAVQPDSIGFPSILLNILYITKFAPLILTKITINVMRQCSIFSFGSGSLHPRARWESLQHSLDIRALETFVSSYITAEMALDSWYFTCTWWSNSGQKIAHSFFVKKMP